MTMQTGEEIKLGDEDSLKILATKINLANAADYNEFVCSIQFDIEELEIYACAMQGLNAAKWAKIMEEKLDQFCKNKT